MPRCGSRRAELESFDLCVLVLQAADGPDAANMVQDSTAEKLEEVLLFGHYQFSGAKAVLEPRKVVMNAGRPGLERDGGASEADGVRGGSAARQS